MKKLFKTLGILALLGFCVIFLDIACAFRYLTGFPCPGCGTTRACIEFFEGHLVEAFYWHPLFWLTPILLLVSTIKGSVIFKNEKLNHGFWLLITVIYLSVFAVRMVLLFPNTAPMDYNYDSILAQVIDFIRRFLKF